MTSLHMVPEDDPASVTSFLRVRKSQLGAGPHRVRGTREAAERRSAEQDADRIMDLLRRMPVEEYVPAADAGPAELEAARYRWLRRHGLERGRVDAALAARREQLGRRVHPPADGVTAGATTSRHGDPRTAPAVASGRAELVDQHAARALAAGTNPRVVERWRRQQLARLVASADDALVAGGSGMTTAQYNRWQRDREAERDLARRWQMLNDRYFGGALPTPDFKVAYLNDLLAEVPARGTKRLDFAAWYTAGTKPGRGTITVRANKVADDGTLIHEMVHQWQHHRGLPVDHGDEFIRRANLVARGGELSFVRNPTNWPHDQSLAASGATSGSCGVGLPASAGPDRPIPVAGPPVQASFGLPGWSNTSGADRNAPGGRASRRRGGR